MNLIPSLYHKLKSEGVDFSDPSVTPKREVTLSKDPNVVSSQQEEDDIAKAIELSLKEKGSASPKMIKNEVIIIMFKNIFFLRKRPHKFIEKCLFWKRVLHVL